MDIIYDRKIFDSINYEQDTLNSNDALYLKDMTEYITDVSYEIFKRVTMKTEKEKISDVINTVTAYKKSNSVTVSAIIICCNEENFIQRCIESILPCKFDEIIVVDTGSTDNTLNILQGLQGKIPNLYMYTTQWEDSFAKARNFGLNLANSDWVFFIDADEYYLSEQKNNIKEIISFYSIYYHGDLCMCPNIVSSNKHELYNNPRIFKRNVGYNYYGHVHEMLRKDKEESYEFVPHIGLNIKFGHDGYDKDIFSYKHKEERNIDLLMKCIELEPDNPLWKCYLARDGMKKLSTDFIIQLCKEAIRLCEFKEDYFFTYNYYWAHELLIDLYININKPDEAIPLLNHIKMNTLEMDESDIYYREQLIYLLKIKKDLEFKLTEVKKYKLQHPVTNRSALNTQGYHLDDLIMRLNYYNHNMDEYHHYRDYLYQLNYLK